MSNTFFQEIFKHMDGVDLQIALKRKGDKIAFTILPIARVDDKAKDMLQPITGMSTPQQLDAELVEQLVMPLDMISEWSLDLKKFEDHMAEVKGKDAKAKEKEKAEKEIQDKIKKHLENAQKDFDEGAYKSALEKVNKALAIKIDNAEANKLKDKIKIQLGTGTLFETANTH
ncbi:MAG: hypothetical protein RLO17_24745 [Cyclobacteriaceae bacterium]|jgi:PRTRC genetic system protein E|tara:strand:+ start:6924 stop:7439 length:516 start_codon:yes stop_codon:yes gene_type:complete